LAKAFIKGNKHGQTGGRPKVCQELKEMRECSKSMVIDTMAEYMGYRMSRLLEITRDDSQPVYRKMVARVILRGIQDGDVRFLDYICERFLGAKPKISTLIDLSDEDVLDGLRAIKGSSG